MLNDYFVLLGLVVTVIFIFLLIGLLTLAIQGLQGGRNPADIDDEKVWKFCSKAAPVLILVMVGCIYLTCSMYQHLAFKAPEVLRNFGVWYITGFICRLPLLWYKDLIFHRHSETDWQEVFATFLTALIGPTQIIVTVFGIHKHHKDWD